ncbi:MAG TPA: hypothetical protein VLC10_00915, partial [Patescibacteria group bacterium]|nr:hypothetical protein [Patescibacteria group bacterium]
VWDGEEFGALPDDLKESVRAWAEASGYAKAAGETAPGDETQPPAPAPEEPKERKEKRERGQQKRRFVEYRVAPDADGGFAIEEDYEEWDDQDKTYKAKTVKTTIAFTTTLAEKMAADPEVALTVAGYAGQIRGELDRSGVKIFFDRPKSEPDKIYPKWKYGLEGKTVQDPIKLDEIPPEVMEEVRKNKEYFKTDAWKKWFGKRMQRKREEVITAELAKLFPERAPKDASAGERKPVREEAAKREPELAPEEPATPETAEEAAETAYVTPELAAGIDMLVDKFTPLFELPKKTEELIAYITQFSKGIFEYQLMRKGARKQALPDETLREAIRASLLAKFSADAATTAEIVRLMPERAAEAIPVADEDVIESRDASADAEVPAQEKRETKGVPPAEAAYRALRDDMDKLKDPDDIDAMIVSLKEMKKSAGIASVIEAADRLLKDIEYGKAGELSEMRTDGMRRSPEEESFLARHPKLDARNIQRLPDGRVIAHIDRLKPYEALERVMRRAVDDVMTSASKGFIDASVAERVAAYLGRIVGGRNANEEVTRRFSRDLASYDAKSDELTIKDIDGLGEVISGLAEKIANGGR